MFDLKNRVVVVSGASSGLGSQMARGFAAQGATLVITARRLEKLEKLAEEIRALGVECLPIKCDVTDPAQVNAAAALAEKTFGKVDVLVNCAGSAKNAGVLEMTDEEWDFTMSADLDSVFYVTRAFANIMKKNNYGRIINIASIYGLVGNTALPTIAYHTSKGAVVNFTRGAAAELATSGITVNAICPGYFYTELKTETLDSDYFQTFAKQSVPMQRYGHEGELNSVAVFLGAEESSYVTGQVIAVDGGYTCV